MISPSYTPSSMCGTWVELIQRKNYGILGRFPIVTWVVVSKKLSKAIFPVFFSVNKVTRKLTQKLHTLKYNPAFSVSDIYKMQYK